MDYTLVEFGQTKVQESTDQYKKDNPNVDMTKVCAEISSTMYSSLGQESVKNIMKNHFNVDNGQKAFDFSSYVDRVKLGKLLVDGLYDK